MLAITRKQAIKKLLQEQKSVTISDLSVRLNVTKETIRRDLRAMEKNQELIRTHGGAYILEGVQNDLDVTTRQTLRIPEKEIIAQKCDTLIQPSDIIFLDSSTTSWYIARKIVNRKLTGNCQYSFTFFHRTSISYRRRILFKNQRFHRKRYCSFSSTVLF